MLNRSRSLFIKEYNNRLFNWLVVFSLVMVVVGRFILKFILLEMGAWILFIFLETYTRLFWTPESLYYNPVWHFIVASWETVVYSPILDLDRFWFIYPLILYHTDFVLLLKGCLIWLNLVITDGLFQLGLFWHFSYSIGGVMGKENTVRGGFCPFTIRKMVQIDPDQTKSALQKSHLWRAFFLFNVSSPPFGFRLPSQYINLSGIVEDRSKGFMRWLAKPYSYCNNRITGLNFYPM